MANGGGKVEVDIKFIPWPYRFATLRSVMLWVLGPAVLAAFALTALTAISACMQGEVEWIGLPKSFSGPCVLWWFASLLVVWVIVFLGFYRHRANAFVRLQIETTEPSVQGKTTRAPSRKIWISYQRGLLGDEKKRRRHSSKPPRWWEKLWGKGWRGFLLQPERGNTENEGVRYADAVGALDTFSKYLEKVRDFAPGGFRIALSTTLKIEDDNTYKLERPGRHDVEPSFYYNEIDVAALNFVPPPIHFWFSGRKVRYLLYRPNEGDLTPPKQGKLKYRARGYKEHHDEDVQHGYGLHRLLTELWLMSRYTGTDIKIERAKRADGRGRNNVYSLIKVAALSIWAAARSHWGGHAVE